MRARRRPRTHLHERLSPEAWRGLAIIAGFIVVAALCVWALGLLQEDFGYGAAEPDAIEVLFQYQFGEHVRAGTDIMIERARYILTEGPEAADERYGALGTAPEEVRAQRVIEGRKFLDPLLETLRRSLDTGDRAVEKATRRKIDTLFQKLHAEIAKTKKTEPAR